MSESTISANTSQHPFQRLLRRLTQVALILPILAVVVVYLVWNRGLPSFGTSRLLSTSKVISTAVLKERYGVEVTLVGVTAAGGMIDFRYRILDKAKAEFLVGAGAEISLIAQDSGVTLVSDSHDMKHNQQLSDGGVYFHFYANRGNAVKPGTPVIVDFGSVRLEPIAAQ